MASRQVVAQRLWAGSAEVARRFGARVASASLNMKIGGGLVAWKAAPVLLDAAHHQPLILPAATCAWCWAAWRAGRPSTASSPAAVEEPEPADTGTAEDEHAAFLALLHRLMPTAGDRAHLAHVATEWAGDPGQTGTVRDLCAALGIEISRGVRVPGEGVSTGIHHRALPPLPEPLSGPAVAVVVAGQNEQQAQQQQHGATARIVPDPSGQPNRWTVQWDDQPATKAG